MTTQIAEQTGTAAKTPRVPFSATQRKILLALAAAVGLRMLGLFLVLPVFTLYGLEFTHSRFLVGFAFGCYGLAMAMTELPLGRLSDRIGRRKVLLLGMSIFSLGSFLCAMPHWFPPGLQIGELIFGRLVQGIGAITATAFATVSDQIPPERRSTAMAILGIPIGVSFILGVIAGPMIAGRFGPESLFWLTGVLGLGTVVMLARYLPPVPPRPAEPTPVLKVLRIRQVLALDLGGFLMNTFMTAFWFYFPLIVTGEHHLAMSQYYHVLLPMVLASGVTMFAFSTGADRGAGRGLAALAYAILFASALLLFRPSLGGFDPRHLASVLVPGMIFLIGFTGLEPVLPSLASRAAPEGATGTTLGTFHTLQYLGSATGAPVAGALAQLPPVYIMTVLAAVAVAGCLLMIFGVKAEK
ncbi:MAG TPA: MFS transporter [Terriglobia bacterium]|nr:MFS transporter [Terriglobia bacterium]